MSGYLLRNTYRVLPTLIFVCAVVQVAAQHTAAELRLSASETGIVAHRSKISRSSVESSVGAVRKALQLGVNFIEVDVRTTLDSQLVILHDGKLDRTTRTNGPMKALTLEELRKVKLKRARGETIPTLDEVASIVSGWNSSTQHKTNLYVDCKDVKPEALLGVLEKHNLHSEAVFYGSDEFLTKLRSIFPKAQIMPALRSAEELTVKAARLRPYAFDVNWKILDADLVKLIHEYHIRVFTDLLALQDNRKNYQKASEMRLDYFQTDRAKKAARVVR